MTRERALELADEHMTYSDAGFWSSRCACADAIMRAVAEERATWRKSAYAEADDAQVLQIGREA